MLGERLAIADSIRTPVQIDWDNFLYQYGSADLFRREDKLAADVCMEFAEFGTGERRSPDNLKLSWLTALRSATVSASSTGTKREPPFSTKLRIACE